MMSMQVQSGMWGFPQQSGVERSIYSNAALKRSDTETNLRMKKQQIENQLLLLKTTTPDSSEAPAKLQKELENTLEKVSAQLRTEQNNPRAYDTYEPQTNQESQTSGIYQP